MGLMPHNPPETGHIQYQTADSLKCSASEDHWVKVGTISCWNALETAVGDTEVHVDEWPLTS